MHVYVFDMSHSCDCMYDAWLRLIVRLYVACVSTGIVPVPLTLYLDFDGLNRMLQGDRTSVASVFTLVNYRQEVLITSRLSVSRIPC